MEVCRCERVGDGAMCRSVGLEPGVGKGKELERVGWGHLEAMGCRPASPSECEARGPQITCLVLKILSGPHRAGRGKMRVRRLGPD